MGSSSPPVFLVPPATFARDKKDRDAKQRRRGLQMAEVSLSAGSRAALAALSSMQSDMGKLQTRLATGKKVGSPIDNPTAYFLSQSLASRATTLASLGDNISAAKSAVS